MTIKISYKDQARTIQLSELPEFDRDTVGLLKKTEAVQRSKVLKDYKYGLTATLKERATSIGTVSNALTEIQEHKTREVICACLKIAFCCAMIAGIVLIGVFGGEFAFLYVLLAIFIYMLLSGHMSAPSAVKLIQFNEKSPWSTDHSSLHYDMVNDFKASIVLSFFALFLPLHEVLTRQGRLERIQNKQNTEMNKDLDTFLKFAEELANNLTAIRQQLQAEQIKTEGYIKELEKISHSAAKDAIGNLRIELAQIQEAQDALTAFEECHSQLLGN